MDINLLFQTVILPPLHMWYVYRLKFATQAVEMVIHYFKAGGQA